MTQGNGNMTSQSHTTLIELDNEQLHLISGAGAAHQCISNDPYAGDYLLQAH
ncbi:MAG: hypothetical protein ACFHVJ_01355 [Aestuariibacter sp.]